MEEIFRRFSGLGKRILQQLDDKNLAKCREVNKTWKKSIDQDKTIWKRQIKKQVGHANWSQDWKMVMLKTSTDTVIELATAVSQFFKLRITRIDHKWSPLHITNERGIF